VSQFPAPNSSRLVPANATKHPNLRPANGSANARWRERAPRFAHHALTAIACSTQGQQAFRWLHRRSGDDRIYRLMISHAREALERVEVLDEGGAPVAHAELIPIFLTRRSTVCCGRAGGAMTPAGGHASRGPWYQRGDDRRGEFNPA